MPAFSAWRAVQTQWRVGIGGAAGLDYAGVCTYLDRVVKGTPRHRRRLFQQLRIMEAAALDAWAQQREESRA